MGRKHSPYTPRRVPFSERMVTEHYRRNTIGAADRLRVAMLDEAALLDAIDAPGAAALRLAAGTLRLSSLERIARSM